MDVEFLAVQWLGLGTFTAGGPGSVVGWGTEICLLCDAKNGKKALFNKAISIFFSLTFPEGFL